MTMAKKKTAKKKPKWLRATPSKTKPVKTMAKAKPRRERIWAGRGMGDADIVVQLFTGPKRPKLTQVGSDLTYKIFVQSRRGSVVSLWRGTHEHRRLLKALGLWNLKPGDCREVKVK